MIQVFTKLKRRAERVQPQIEITHQSPSTFESGKVTPLRDIEPNVQRLGESAMSSYRLRSDVFKTENGFEVV